MKKKDLLLRVSELAAPICEHTGVTLWDVTFEKEVQGNVLTLFIDRAGGVFIEDCEAVSRAIDPLLDAPEFDSLPAYTLSVSSPGLERRMRTDEHLAWAVGKTVDVTLYKAENGRSVLSGELISYDGSELVIAAQAGPRGIEREKVSKISLHFDGKIGK